MKILFALIKKEFFQIVRDPSSIIIAFVMPLMLLLLYMYAINLDTVKVTLGIKNDDPALEVQTLIKSFSQSNYVNAVIYSDKELMYEDIVRSKLRGAVIIPNDFSRKLSQGKPGDMLVITDGSETNTASLALGYPLEIANIWLSTSKYSGSIRRAPVNAELRYWYNQEINSHYFILPGSIAVTMTLIGILLTALVVAREWERGTMEALLGTGVKKIHIVLGKYIPYFVLGMMSMFFSVFMCIVVFGIPFHGSLTVLFSVSALFLFACMGVGLFISTNLKDQFLASQTALSIGYLPALMLSGLTFPINSMPEIFQWCTYIIPTRYFVTFILSEFLAGTIWYIVLINSIYLIALGVILYVAVYNKTMMRLE